MIENTVDVICIINTRHQKQKDVKKKFIFMDIMIHALIMKLQQYNCFLVAQCNQYYCFTVA